MMINHRHSVLSMLAVAVMAILGLSGCGDIEHNLRINADGSGSLETSFNIGEMMGMMKGFSQMDMMDTTLYPVGENDTTSVTPKEPKDPMQDLMEQVTSPDFDRDFDTLISFLNIMPDSVKEKETRPDLVNKLAVRIKSPAKSADLVIGLVMNFDHQAQLQELVDYMETIDSNSNVLGGASPGGLKSEAFLVFEADLKAGWIRFDSMDYSSVSAGFGMTSDSLMSSEDMGMMEMMFGGTKIKSIVHVPGELISCTNTDAILTRDNRVIVEYGFMDAVRKGKVEGFTIYFTPVK